LEPDLLADDIVEFIQHILHVHQLHRAPFLPSSTNTISSSWRNFPEGDDDEDFRRRNMLENLRLTRTLSDLLRETSVIKLESDVSNNTPDKLLARLLSFRKSVGFSKPSVVTAELCFFRTFVVCVLVLTDVGISGKSFFFGFKGASLAFTNIGSVNLGRSYTRTGADTSTFPVDISFCSPFTSRSYPTSWCYSPFRF